MIHLYLKVPGNFMSFILGIIIIIIYSFDSFLH